MNPFHRRLCPLLVAGCLLPVFPAPSAAAPGVVRLANGLRVVLAPDAAATAVDVAVWYPGGPRWERDGQAGISHLVERLMFRGSAHVRDGEHLGALTAQGGIVNTVGAPDYACFWETLPAEALGQALRLEADRMGGVAANPAVFEQERRAAIDDARAREERRRRAPDMAGALARLNGAVFAGQPYASALEGTPADLARFKPADVDGWRRGHYGAGGAAITIVGRFDSVATLAMVRRLFERLPSGTNVAAPAAAAAPAPGPRRDSAPGDAPVRLLLAGWRTAGAADPDRPVLQLIAALMGGGDASRLQKALVRQWTMAGVTQAGYVPHRDASLLWGFAALAADADSSSAERVLLDEFARLTREPPDDAELDRARLHLLEDERVRLQTVRARAAAIGEGLQLTDDPGESERRLAALARVTPADIQRVAQRVLNDAALAVVWVSPVGGAQ